MKGLYALAVAVLLAGAAHEAAVRDAAAQGIPPRGTDATFDVATWNVEQFGSTSSGPSDEDQQLENVRQVIIESDVDLWSVQEIDDEDHFERLLTALGPEYDGVLGGASTNLKMGFIYKRAVVDRGPTSDVWLSQFSSDFAGRPPLLMRADVYLAETTVEIYLVSLHMKCCGSGSDYEQRLEASTRMKTRLDFSHASDAFIILGDFNDELSGSISGSNPTPYANFLSDTEGYSFTSRVLDENDEETWCGNASCSSGSILDHILITDELFDAYVEGSTDRYEELLDAFDGYTSTTSDHLPVFARFAFPPNTAAEGPTDASFGFDSIHPNPVSTNAAIRFSLGKPAGIRMEIYDSLGREAMAIDGGFRAPGEHRIELLTAGLPPGLYFVRLAAGDRSTVRPFVIAR